MSIISLVLFTILVVGYYIYQCIAICRDSIRNHRMEELVIDDVYGIQLLHRTHVSHVDINNTFDYLVEINKMKEIKFSKHICSCLDKDKDGKCEYTECKHKECCICFDENEQRFIVQPYCNHKDKYCKNCLLKHMMHCVKTGNHFVCPICREQIIIPDAESETEYSLYDHDTESIYTNDGEFDV